MNLNETGKFIKQKRKELGLTQEELANKLFVTEKTISRWETGRGTPDISLLLPLSKELDCDVSQILGEKKDCNDIEKVIEYVEISKNKFSNNKFKLSIFFNVLSLLVFLLYLKGEYNPNFEMNYFIRLTLVLIASVFTFLGNRIYTDNFIEKVNDKRKMDKVFLSIIFIYYIIFMFNMLGFARYSAIFAYNTIPFKTIYEIMNSGNLYTIVINIFGNFFVFMPLEYFLIKLFGMKKILSNFIMSFICLISIEICQFIFKIGVADIDDILLCMTGMLTFYFFYFKISKKG